MNWHGKYVYWLIFALCRSHDLIDDFAAKKLFLTSRSIIFLCEYIFYSFSIPTTQFKIHQYFYSKFEPKKKKTIQSIVTEIRWLFLSIIFQKSACHTIGWICDSATVVLSLRCASSPTPQQNRNECVPNEYEPVSSEWNKIQMESMVLCHSLLDPQQQRKR